jgi:hypothetical protein
VFLHQRGRRDALGREQVEDRAADEPGGARDQDMRHDPNLLLDHLKMAAAVPGDRAPRDLAGSISRSGILAGPARVWAAP